MKTIKQLLTVKGNDIWAVEPGDSVFDAIAMMAEKGVGALLVMQDSKTVGILSERDYARKVILQGRSSKDTAVREIMTPDVVFVGPENTIEECMALMTDKRIRHLPVLEDKKLLGVVSIGDLVKAIISDQRFRIEQLERYVSG
ncbi:MAG: CBS domain-containing protein [Gemmatimonadota bacterium]